MQSQCNQDFTPNLHAQNPLYPLVNLNLNLSLAFLWLTQGPGQETQKSVPGKPTNNDFPGSTP